MSSDDWLNGFKPKDFPTETERYVVYVIGIEWDGQFAPFYVGESSRSWTGRIGDYVSHQFKAATDFKVGIAVECLRHGAEGHPIKVWFKQSQKEKKLRMDMENELKAVARTKCPHILLNDFFITKSQNESEEEIHKWASEFLSKLRKSHSSPDG